MKKSMLAIILLLSIMAMPAMAELKLPEGIREISDQAFYGDVAIDVVVVPEGAERIGSEAFANCSNLSEITIPDSIQFIADDAFSGSDQVRIIANADSYAYEWAVEKGYIESTLNPNPASDFEYTISNGECTITGYVGSSTEVVIPRKIEGAAVTSIGNYAFAWCYDLKNITIPEGVTSIGNYAFTDCSSLTSITIPEGVTNMGSYMFYWCRNLKSITIPEGVTSIGDRAFYHCSSLKSIAIPEGVTSIGNYAFTDCSSLTSITIREGVTSIGDSAFAYCSNLTSITIPEGVTSIGDRAFSGCSSLTSITIPEGVTSIGDRAFYYCRSLANITIPQSVTSIGDYAFVSCYRLTNVTMPEGVTSIGDRAFSDCSSLTSITIPESVRCIGNKAFMYCESLTSIMIPKGVTSIGDNAFSGCASLESISVDKDNTVCSSENGVLFSKDQSKLICYPSKKTIESYSIPESVTDIGDHAFYYCSALKSITIPESVTSIGDYAFYYCCGLRSITIPEGMTSIGSHVFDFCRNLESITIPEGVTSIGDMAFFQCENFTSITLPESVTSIGWSAFELCRRLTSIYIPESIAEIGSCAFDYCSENLVIYGEAGSYAESWAQENGFSFSTHYYEEVILPKEAITIGGRVCLEDGSGLSGVKVTICYNKDILSGRTETDSDGYWKCDGLRPNQEYTICYDCKGYGIATSTYVAKDVSMTLADVIAMPNIAEAVRFTQPLDGENVSPYEALFLAWTPVEGAKYYEYSARYLDQEEAFIFRRKTESTEAWIPIPDMQEDNTLQLWVAAFVDSDDEMLSQQIIRVTTNVPEEIPEHTCEWGEEYNVGENWYRKCTICGITIACTKPMAGDSVCEHGNLRSCCCICVGCHDWVDDKPEMGAGEKIYTYYHCARCGESIDFTSANDSLIYYCALEKIPQNGNPLDDSIVEEYLRNKMNGYVSNKNQTAILQALRKASTVYQQLYLYSIAEYNYELTDGSMQYAHGKRVMRINEAKNSDMNEFLSVWFHEAGHAIDANSGAANTHKTNDTAVINGVEQNELFFYLMLDAKSLIYKCIYQIENDGSLGCTLTSEERDTIASAILDPNKDKTFDSERLNNAMELLCEYRELEITISNYTLDNYVNSQMVGDIWGGLTGNYIYFWGKGHTDKEYWYKNGKPTYNQCQEAFAEFFSAQVLGIDAIKNNNATVFPLGTTKMKSMCSELKESYRKKHNIAA